MSPACAKALVWRAECTPWDHGGHLTKPSKHWGTTGIQYQKLPTCMSTCFLARLSGQGALLGTRRNPEKQGALKQDNLTWVKFFKDSTNALTPLLWLMENKQPQLVKPQQWPSSSSQGCSTISTLQMSKLLIRYNDNSLGRWELLKEPYLYGDMQLRNPWRILNITGLINWMIMKEKLLKHFSFFTSCDFQLTKCFFTSTNHILQMG